MYSCNCTNVFFHKNPFNPCSESIDFAINAEFPGEYVLNLSFLDTDVQIKKVFEQYEALIFPLKGLNENFEYLAKIFSPQQTEVTKTIGEITYNCFSFKTAFKKTL